MPRPVPSRGCSTRLTRGAASRGRWCAATGRPSPASSPDGTPAAIRIDVDTASRTSAIWIGDGIAEQLSGLLDAHGVGRRRFIVSSPVIWRLHGKQLQQVAGDTEPILIPDGERNKNLQSVS